MATIIILITVLSRDPTQWRLPLGQRDGNKKRQLLDHKSYSLNIGPKEWAIHSETYKWANTNQCNKKQS